MAPGHLFGGTDGTGLVTDLARLERGQQFAVVRLAVVLTLTAAATEEKRPQRELEPSFGSAFPN